MRDDQLFFAGQKGFIEKDGKLLILIDPEMGTDLPGGKVQEGETDLEQALKREVLEETGLTISVEKPFITWVYQIPVDGPHRSAGKKIFNVGYLCHYLSGDISLSEEHSHFHWISRDDYQQYAQNAGFKKGIELFFSMMSSGQSL